MKRLRPIPLFVLLLALLIPAARSEPVKNHPRLLFRSEDLPGLRARMNPTNDVWVLFKQMIVDKSLRDWKCSSVSTYSTNLFYLTQDPVSGQTITNYYSGWIRTQFTDEFGVVHNPGDPDWGLYSNQGERPASPEDDIGEPTGIVRHFSEQYAMVFALMARLYQDQPGLEAERAEYLAAAKDCLFKIVEQAHKGNANLPWRYPGFAVTDRSFSAEAFGLTVDWIYEDLTPLELAQIRKAFLVWSKQCNDHIYFAPHQVNGQHGPANSTDLLRLNDPSLSPPRYEVRLALNNHYANHARQMVLYALAFDPKDDVPVDANSPAFGVVDDAAPAGSLTSHLATPAQPDAWVQQPFGVLHDTLGVWLYLMDYGWRHDGAGGISVEGTQYASNGLGPSALLMTALQSAGQDDPAKWGPQVSMAGHPFWSRMIPAYLAMLTPAPRVPGNSTGHSWLGPIFQPPLTGDLETFLYINNQFIKVLAPLALYDARVNGSTGSVAQAARYIQRHLAQGGASKFSDRMNNYRSNKTLRDSIYTFLLFDPTAPPAVDPRPALQAKTFLSTRTVEGNETGMVLARSGVTTNDTYFYTHVSWVGIDHIIGDSLTFGLWKNGLWLTKPMTGYGNLPGCSDYRNSLSLQNGVPSSDGIGWMENAAHGAQWNYSSLGDPKIVARSFGQSFLYMNMDATARYTHRTQSQLREVTQASRRLVWLKPDVLVMHDTAWSKQPGFFKRVFINLPETPQILNNIAHASAKEDGVAQAEVFVTQLLPAGAILQTKEIASGQPSAGEDMKIRLFTEAPGHPQKANFLHVIEGANAGAASPIPAQTVSSIGGQFEGATVGTAAVLFRKDPDSIGDAFSYVVPANVTQHYLTGLTKSAGFDVTFNTSNGQTTVTLIPGGTQSFSDSGGVLVLGGNEPATVDIAALDSTGSEQGGDSIAFEFHRSGDVSAPLTVNLSYAGQAAAADFTGAPTTVHFSAGSPIATLTLTPQDDAIYENEEQLVLQVTAGAGYSPSEVLFEATASIADNDAPPGGYVQFASANFTANEGDGLASITVQRVGGVTGAVSAQISASGLQPASQPVSWNDGDNTDKIVTFPVPNDVVYTGDKTANLSIGSVTLGAGLGTPKSATLTIVDDDPAPPGQITFATASTNVIEAAGSLTIYVHRVNGKGGAVTVNLTASGGATPGSDYSFSPSSLNWVNNDDSPKPVTITLLQDNTYEGASESLTLTLGIGSGAATLGGQSTFTVVVNEDDPQPQEYDVGDGWPYPKIGDVPWKNLGPGAIVKIHGQANPYREKILLSTRGSAAEPIQVMGIPGPNGEKPVLEGANASSPASLGYESWSYTPILSIVAVARGANTPANSKPGYIEISNLKIGGSIGSSFTNVNGVMESYSGAGGALYLRGAEHVVIRDCEFHHAPNGLVAENYSSESEVNRDILIERSWFHDNAAATSWAGNNLQVEAIGVTVQFCRFDANLNRDKTSNIRDRSAGAIYRYNWIEGGSGLMEIIEPAGAIQIVKADPGFTSTHVYGNVLVNRNADGSSMIRFGGSYYGSVPDFRPLLHFYHNTVVLDSTSTGRAVFSLAQNGPTVEARNNVLHSSASQFLMISSSTGIVNLGVNWAKNGWINGWNGGVVYGGTNILSGPDPGFVSFAGNDFHLMETSVLRNAAGSLINGVPPITEQYKATAQGELRLTTSDLGAFAFFNAPIVTTGAATALKSTAATLNGTIQPNTGPVSAFFQWGPTAAYGSASQPVNAGSGTNLFALSTGLSNLPVQSTVHFRLVAQIGAALFAGNDQTFGTSSNTPPAAIADVFSTKVNTLLVVKAVKLLENDSDVDDDGLTVTSVSPASAQGGQVLLTNGFLSYAPLANFVGDDAISYAISDGQGGSSIANVTIHVEPITPPLPSLQGVGVSAAGNPVVSFVVPPQSSWLLQASSNFGQWDTLGVTTAGANGVVSWEDTLAGGQAVRFYRVMQSP